MNAVEAKARMTSILSEISEIESRLGTPEERPGDFVRVTDLVHSLCNSVAVQQSDRVMAALRQHQSTDSASPLLFAGGGVVAA